MEAGRDTTWMLKDTDTFFQTIFSRYSHVIVFGKIRTFSSYIIAIQQSSGKKTDVLPILPYTLPETNIAPENGWLDD